MFNEFNDRIGAIFAAYHCTMGLRKFLYHIGAKSELSLSVLHHVTLRDLPCRLSYDVNLYKVVLILKYPIRLTLLSLSHDPRVTNCHYFYRSTLYEIQVRDWGLNSSYFVFRISHQPPRPLADVPVKKFVRQHRKPRKHFLKSNDP